MRRYPEYKDSGIEWIGEIPKDWAYSKLRYHLSESSGGIWGEDDDFGTGTYVLRSTEITLDGSWNLQDLVKRELGDEDTEKFLVQRGDLIVTKSSGSQDHIGKTGLVGKEIESMNACYSNFVQRIRPNDRLNSKFLHYFMNCPIAREQYKYQSETTTGLANLSKQSIGNLLISIPFAQEQTQIANFLDRKTQQIDELIRAKERKIELLGEYRASLIHQAVTKGLDPNVEMKPSGVAWIGDIPKAWNTVPLTKYLESIIDYRGRTPEKTERGRFLVTAKNVKNGQLDYQISREFTSEPEYQKIMTRGIPQMGDVLFTTEAPLGQVANVDDPSIALAQRIIKLRPKPNLLDPYFLKYWMLSPSFQSDLQRYATGSTVLGIKASKLCLLKLNLPPLKNQAQIVNFLGRKTKQIDELRSNEEQTIKLLKEYRQSLISAVVTGKIDVRNEV